MFAADEQLAGRTITVVGAVLHQLASPAQPSIIASAFHATTALLASTRGVLVTRRVITRGATLTWITAPWAAPVALHAARSVSIVGWPGLRIHTSIATPPHLSVPLIAGQDVGTVVVAAGEQHAEDQLLASRALPDASLAWRLSHPLAPRGAVSRGRSRVIAWTTERQRGSPVGSLLRVGFFASQR